MIRALGLEDMTEKPGRQIVLIYTYPDATTGTYAGRWAPCNAHRYSKCAARADSDNPGREKSIVWFHALISTRSDSLSEYFTFAWALPLIVPASCMRSCSAGLLIALSGASSDANDFRLKLDTLVRASSMSDRAGPERYRKKDFVDDCRIDWASFCGRSI